MNSGNSEPQLWRIDRVLAATGLSKTVVYRLMAEGGFPKPTRLGLRARAWVSSEVQDWVAGRIAERNARSAA